MMRKKKGQDMMRRQGRWCRIVAVLLLMAVSTTVSRAALAADDAFIAAQKLGRGVNVLGYDPLWWNPTKARFQDRHFAAIRAVGFQTIRVNLIAFKHMDAANRLDPRWLERLDWVVAGALAQGLNVILDEHDFDACAKDAVACRTRLASFWRQVAPRYRNTDSHVLFEILNEPHGALTAELWNQLFAEMLALVRESNPTRTVIVGPANYNDPNQLDQLRLPAADRNLIVTFHYYAPFSFTHQGAPWVENGPPPTGIGWGSADDVQRVTADFDEIARRGRALDRPLFLGEFGAYDKGAMDARAAYTATVARAAEAEGWPWAYWQFDSDFIAYDMKTQDWVVPILKALVP